MQRFLTHFSQHRLVGGTIVLSVTQLGASVAGLLRDRALTTTFPTLRTVDVYIASFRLSDLLFQMFIMAGFSVALVPLLAKYKVENNTQKMLTMLSGIMNIAAIFFGSIALIAGLFFRNVAPYITNFTGADLELFIVYGRMALFTNFLFVFGNALGQYLITVQKYIWYGITPILYTVGTIIGTLYFSTPDTFAEFGPMFGTIIGATLYVLIRLIAVVRHGGGISLRLWHPEIKDVVLLMLPRTIALATLQLQLLIFDAIASSLPLGSVTINAYARNFQSVIVGVFGIAIAQSSFSLLSQSIAGKQFERFWMYIKKGVYTILFVTIPSSIILVLCTPIAAWLVGIQSHSLFAYALLLYAISIPFESINHILLRGFYAAKHTLTPAIFSIISGIVAITLSWYFAPKIGVYALPLGFTVGQIVQGVALAIYLPRVVGNRV